MKPLHVGKINRLRSMLRYDFDDAHQTDQICAILAVLLSAATLLLEHDKSFLLQGNAANIYAYTTAFPR